MIKGARFYKCDFQVHTPRDARFLGRKPYISDAERKVYSESFIKACRDKSLDAVAITDHHDLGFYPYIKYAAENEIGVDGKLIPIDKRIIIFPGMELTLAVPCQALLIFDAFLEINDTLRVQLYTALNIESFTEPSAPKTGETQRLKINHINEVFERLDKVQAVRGKYLLLPNAKPNGGDTIFRDGFHTQYADGHFIAGYLDGNNYEKYCANQGWLNKINGIAKEYGKRSIAIFQTSDNRTDTFDDLGKGHTWVKFFEPTAEGLRQACLAKVSRISQNKPALPSVYIDRVQVTNSTFLQDLDLSFNPQLNILIGGRGTGKSSVLRYVMYALGKTDKQLDEFIGSTLANGTVKLTVIQNGVTTTITKSRSGHIMQIGIGDKEFADYDIIKKIIQVDAYTQKELSQHKNNRITLVDRLLSFSIESNLEQIHRKLEDNKSEIEKEFINYQAAITARKRERELRQLKSSLEQQVAELEKTLTGERSDQKIIERQNTIELEREYLSSIKSHYDDVFLKVQKFIESQIFNVADINFTPANNSEITAIKDFLNTELLAVKNQLASILSLKKNEKVIELSDDVMAHIDNFTEEYKEAKARMEGSKEALKNIEQFRKEIKTHGDQIEILQQEIDKHVSIEKRLHRLFLERFSLSRNEFYLKKKEAERLSICAEGGLEIQLIDFTDTSEIARRFADRIKRAISIQDKSQAYFTTLANNGSLRLRKKLFRFWSVLLRCKVEESVDLKELLEEQDIKPDNFTDNDFTKVKESLTLNDILQLALIVPTYHPKLFYYLNDANKIPFSNASDGQQAGAILQILLNQTNGSLLIDQPEDDLDNKVVHQITERICKTKENRQIIFSSHNANIAVNGDAELIVHLEHNNDKSAGEARVIGTIDSEDIRNSIKDVMEGGEAAFRLRAKKYNFTYQ